jgi:hypothetical protein
LAAPVLRDALEKRPSLEVRRRIDRLLEKLADLSAEQRRAIRSVELLEQLGTPQARALLRKLSSGATGARLTRDAKAALGRLARQSTIKP